MPSIVGTILYTLLLFAAHTVSISFTLTYNNTVNITKMAVNNEADLITITDTANHYHYLFFDEDHIFINYTFYMSSGFFLSSRRLAIS